jgi:DNA mismatch endonuclease (patch repair protein)
MTRRRADVLVTRRHVAVFVDGYLWHSCPLHSLLPPSNHDSWVAELEKNVSRDLRPHLLAIGWGMSALLGA